MLIGLIVVRHLPEQQVEDCPCQHGCPACIIDPHCREYNRFLSKRGALAAWQHQLRVGSPIVLHDGAKCSKEWLQGLESGNIAMGGMDLHGGPAD